MKQSQISNYSFLINLKWLMAGLTSVVVGFLLMYQAPSENSTVFNPEVFSSISIGLAPLVVLIGYLIIGISIFKR